MKEWKEVKFSEAINIIGGGTPKTSNLEYWNGDIPWLSVVDFNNGLKYVHSTEKSITKKGLNNSSTKLLQKGDIIISARGTVGVTAMLGKAMAFNQSCYGIRGIRDVSDTDFIYYLLNDIVFKLKQIAHGGVFDTITRSTFNVIPIFLPPLKEQKAIAEVLSNLDDKIELLQQQNETLEQLAETLFRQWFIEEAEEDWEEKTLGDIASVIDNRGKTPPWTSNKTLYPIIEVNALTGSSRIVDYSVIKKYVTEQIFNSWFRSHPKKYDTLISTVGSIGEIAMYLIESGSIAQNIVALSSKVDTPLFLYQILKYLSPYIKRLDIGAVQPSIKVPHILALRIKLPSKELIISFEKRINSYINKIESNQRQIQTLTKMRDTLLPKLMSGAVRVKLAD